MNLTLVQKLWSWAAQRRRPPGPRAASSPPRRVLVIRLNRLGDLVCALPVYRTLQASWPEARIDWLLSSQNAALAPFLRPQGRIFVLPASGFRYWVPGRLLRDLQAQAYDYSFAVKGGFDSRLAWISLAAGARARFGFRGKAPGRFEFAYTQAPPPPESHIHQVEKGLKLLEPLQLSKRADDISLTVPAPAREKMLAHLRGRGVTADRPLAVLLASTTKRAFMRWPAEHFVDLGRRLREHGLTVCVNALPAERAAAEELARAIGGGAAAVCFGDLGEYLALLAAARVVIGTDGGGIHLAAAMGAHTVAFYAESHPVKWRPWQGRHLQFYTANRPVAEITPEKIWEQLLPAGFLDAPAGDGRATV